MYLEGRWSLPVNSNPFYLLENWKGLDQVAELTWKIVNWGQMTKSKGLIDDSGCQQSYPLTVGTSRHPHLKGRDYLQTHNLCTPHVVVIKNSKFYKLPVNSLSSMKENFKVINDLSEGEDVCVGVGTGLGRDDWGELRGSLGNEVAFHDIDSAAFIVCLDEHNQGMNENEESRNMLASVGNRWYDKHQLILLGNGEIGFNWEHSFSDGMIWNRLIQDCETLEYEDTGAGGEGGFEEVKFSFDEKQKEDIKEAENKVMKELEACNHNHLQGSFGKDVLKTWKVSPDASMQMAYQLAYYKMHGSVPPVYESCATRNFWRGRTETIRSATVESRGFVESFLNDNISDDAKREAFQIAAARHVEIAGEAKQGLGVDRIFLALEKEAEKMGVDVDFFNSDVYKESKSWKLSTSNVSHPSLKRFGFGPVVGDGYGLGYLVGGKSFSVNVTNFEGGGTDGERMKGEIMGAIEGLRKLF